MAQEIRVQPKDPQSARAEIERTRARMSGTLDEIEDRLIYKKKQLNRAKTRLKEQLDVIARVREKPLQAAGIVFGVGLLLGFLTGGDDDDGSEEKARLEAEGRAAYWEDRALRLLSIARAQEAEIEELESEPVQYATLVTPASEWEEEGGEDDEHEGPSRWSEVRDTVTSRFGGLLSKAAERAATEFRRRF